MTGWAIARLGEMDVAEPVVADLGTGSGAIALAIGQEVPRARVHAVEADPLARAWAERHITRYVESVPYTAGRGRSPPPRRAVERRGRADRHPRRGAHRAAAAAPRRPGRRRARRAAGQRRVLGVPRGIRVAG